MIRFHKRKREKMGVRKGWWYRSASYLAYVRTFRCLIEGKNAHMCSDRIEAAHARFGTDGAGGEKPSDWWTVPLCSDAHREQHQIGEPAFDRKYGIVMKAAAQLLWNSTGNLQRRRDYEKERASDTYLPEPHQLSKAA